MSLWRELRNRSDHLQKRGVPEDVRDCRLVKTLFRATSSGQQDVRRADLGRKLHIFLKLFGIYLDCVISRVTSRKLPLEPDVLMATVGDELTVLVHILAEPMPAVHPTILSYH